MNLEENFKSSIKTLKGNKARSFLTMLGIVIGIASVITMSAIGKGGQENITGNLKKTGYGKFTVYVDREDQTFRWKYLLDDDIIEKLKNTNKFKAVSPMIKKRLFAKVGGRDEIMWLTVTTPEYEEIDKINITDGRSLLSFEYKTGERSILIDHITAKDLFGSSENALGKSLEMSQSRKSIKIPYTIVGVFQNQFEQYVKAMGGRRIPRFVRMPLRTYDKVYDLKANGYTDIVIESKNPDFMSEDMGEAKRLLEEITGVKDLYEVGTLSDGASSFDNILTTLNIFVIFVAGISLFVGGIGVMNIMLVSVIERTKEIGIRKAIGATDTNILMQFLLEAVILTGCGGIIGIIFGVLLGSGIGNIVGIPPIFSIWSITISLAVSMSIGIIFGVIPAKKAAKLNPIDALRSE